MFIVSFNISTIEDPNNRLGEGHYQAQTQTEVIEVIKAAKSNLYVEGTHQLRFTQIDAPSADFYGFMQELTKLVKPAA